MTPKAERLLKHAEAHGWVASHSHGRLILNGHGLSLVLWDNGKIARIQCLDADEE